MYMGHKISLQLSNKASHLTHSSKSSHSFCAFTGYKRNSFKGGLKYSVKNDLNIFI